MKHCKGCSHPTICDSHGCGAEEARANRARMEAAIAHERRKADQQAKKDQLLRDLIETLQDARDDVCDVLNRLQELAGRPSTDRRIAAQQAQLQRLDDVLERAGEIMRSDTNEAADGGDEA